MKALCGPPYPTHCRRGEETPHVTTPTSPQSAKRGTQTKHVVETLVIIAMATNMYVSVLLVTDCERYNRPQRTLSASRLPTANRTAATSCQLHSGATLPTAQWQHLANRTVAAFCQLHSGGILPTAQWRHFANCTVAASCQPHCGNILPTAQWRHLANRTVAASCQPHSGGILPTAQWRHLANRTVAASYQPHCQEPLTQVYAAIATTPYDITDRLLIAGVELPTAYNLDHFLMATNCGTVLKGNRSSPLIGTVGITFC